MNRDGRGKDPGVWVQVWVGHKEFWIGYDMLGFVMRAVWTPLGWVWIGSFLF